MPVDAKVIMKREIQEYPLNSNNFYLILTSIDDNKKITKEKFLMKKKEFIKSFIKIKNKYHPIFSYIINIPESSKYYICNSIKPKLAFIPFIGEYTIFYPDYFYNITPNYIHVRWEEDLGKIYEIVHQKLSFLGADIVIPELIRNGPFDLEWEHNHKSKYSFCYINNGTSRELYKHIEYILIESGKTRTEGHWNQIHIKEPDKYQLGDGKIYITEKIITKDNQSYRPTAPFECEIYVPGNKSNGFSRGNPSGWERHRKGEQIQTFRHYHKRWKLSPSDIDYASWGDTIKYRNAIGYNPSSGNLSLIW